MTTFANHPGERGDLYGRLFSTQACGGFFAHHGSAMSRLGYLRRPRFFALNDLTRVFWPGSRQVGRGVGENSHFAFF